MMFLAATTERPKLTHIVNVALLHRDGTATQWQERVVSEPDRTGVALEAIEGVIEARAKSARRMDAERAVVAAVVCVIGAGSVALTLHNDEITSCKSTVIAGRTATLELLGDAIDDRERARLAANA